MLCLVFPCSRALILYAIHPPLVFLPSESHHDHKFEIAILLQRHPLEYWGKDTSSVYTACYDYMCIHTCIFVIHTFLYNFTIIYVFKNQVTGRVKWSKGLTKKPQHRSKTCSEFLQRAVLKEASVCWLAELRNQRWPDIILFHMMRNKHTFTPLT